MEECVMERIGEMIELVKYEKNFLIENRIQKMNMEFIKEERKLFRMLINDSYNLAGDNKKGSLTISYLRSSYITREHVFWVAFYADELFVEEYPPNFYFRLDTLFESVHDDLQEMMKIMRKKFIRILEAEKEEVYRWYVEQLYKNIGLILKPLLAEMKGEKGINIYFGGFMEEVDLIGSI